MVQGRVLNEDLKPLVCAVANPSVSEKVLTDNNGDFSMKSKPGDTLIFSGIGFTDEIRIVGNSTKKINVILMNKQVNCLGAVWSKKEYKRANKRINALYRKLYATANKQNLWEL